MSEPWPAAGRRLRRANELCYLPADFTGPGGPGRSCARRSCNATSCRDRSPAGALIGDCVGLASDSTGTSGLAERYATALFDLADARHSLDAVAADLRELRAMLRDSGDLVRLLRSPVLSRGEQGKAIAVLSERAALAPLTRDFLGVVAKNRRLFAIPAMIEAYLKRLADRRGEITAEVTVAQPLDAARQAALDEQLRRTVGARVAVDIRVDPALLGGMIVKIGSRMVDASVNSRLQRLRLAMKGIG